MKTITLLAALLLGSSHSFAQKSNTITRIAKLTVDSLQLNKYKALLKEQMETAVKVEPGVLSYKVYADKTNPAILFIMEVYASNEAYLAHRETPHFKKYKTAVTNMVKSLELTELEPIMSTMK